MPPLGPLFPGMQVQQAALVLVLQKDPLHHQRHLAVENKGVYLKIMLQTAEVHIRRTARTQRVITHPGFGMQEGPIPAYMPDTWQPTSIPKRNVP